MGSVISQSTESLFVYLFLIIWDATNFDVGGHRSNIKIAKLNITKLST